MGPPKDKDDDLGDVYELLGIEESAGDKEVQTAFRKGSLKWHPDKNPDNPEAADKFDQLQRAKDLLLDPQKRAAYDEQRKAKRALAERYAQEDSKRRKLREELEGRENAAERLAEAGLGPNPARENAAEARKKYVQADTAARIKAREAERSQRLGEVASKVADARASASQARVRITWRQSESAPTAETIAQVLGAFGVKSIEIGETEATAQFASREDAIGAVLHCRERKQELPFRAAMAPAQAKNEQPQHPATGAPPPQAEAAKPPRPAAGQAAAAPKAPGGAFDSWEADMLGDLAALAKAQKAKKAG